MKTKYAIAFIRMSPNAAEMNHAFHACLQNGLFVVTGQFTAFCHQVKVMIEEVSWGDHTIHGICAGKGGCKKFNICYRADGSGGTYCFNGCSFSGLLLITVTAWPFCTNSSVSGLLMCPNEPISMIFMLIDFLKTQNCIVINSPV